MPRQVGAVNRGKDIDLIPSFLLAWAYIFPTATRFCPPPTPAEKPVRRARYMLAPSVGVMSAVVIMGALGPTALRMTAEPRVQPRDCLSRAGPRAAGPAL